MAKNKTVLADSVDFPLAPKPRTSILTGILCVLNILAAAAFLYIMMLDLEKRQIWTHANFLTDVTNIGLAFQDDDKKFSGVRETNPQPVLDREELAKVYRDRKPGGAPVKGAFVALTVMPPPPIDPRNFDPETLKTIFGSLPSPSASLEEEVNKVKASILKDISDAAVAEAKIDRTSEDKRKEIDKVLLPQAVDAFQVLELAQFIGEIEESKLDEFIIAAHERRMLLDILRPIEIVRPGDAKLPYLDLGTISELKDLKVKEFQDKLLLRLKNAVEDTYNGEINLTKEQANKERPAIEKHDNIAFLLFTIAHTLKPGGDKLLYESGPLRVQTVVGIHAFATAAGRFTKAVASIRAQFIEKIRNDREGAVVFLDKGRTSRTSAFTARYAEMIQRIREQITAIDRATELLKLKKEQAAKAEKMFFEGEDAVRAKEKDLQVERFKTAKLLENLQAIQARLFRSQLELANAAKINEDLHRQVEDLERELARIQGIIPKKGRAP